MTNDRDGRNSRIIRAYFRDGLSASEVLRLLDNHAVSAAEVIGEECGRDVWLIESCTEYGGPVLAEELLRTEPDLLAAFPYEDDWSF